MPRAIIIDNTWFLDRANFFDAGRPTGALPGMEPSTLVQPKVSFIGTTVPDKLHIVCNCESPGDFQIDTRIHTVATVRAQAAMASGFGKYMQLKHRGRILWYYNHLLERNAFKWGTNATIEAWRRSCRLLRDLGLFQYYHGLIVDPYEFSELSDQWYVTTEALLNEARLAGVTVALMYKLEYHTASATLAETYVPWALLKARLDWAATRFSHIFIHGGYNGGTSARSNWSAYPHAADLTAWVAANNALIDAEIVASGASTLLTVSTMGFPPPH